MNSTASAAATATAPKKPGGKETVEKKKRMMSLEMKREIIEKHSQGVRVSELARLYDRTTSTICTVLKKKEMIIPSLSSFPQEEGHGWAPDKGSEEEGNAIALYENVKQEPVEESEGECSSEATVDELKSPHDWFDKSTQKQTGIHWMVGLGDGTNADAEEFCKKFSELVIAEGYHPQQVFNCDETGLFWKKMPRRTYITMEERNLPGHKPMKDRLSIALCANVSGDCKIKPLLVYHTENPRAFKVHKVLKERLQVMWRSNPRSWITRQFFVDWMNLVFGPSVKKYLQDNKLPLKCLLVLDNASAHHPSIEDDILDEFQFIRIAYLPPYTTSILQPMDQEVITSFKKYYTKLLFRRCYDVIDNTNLTLIEFWKDHYNIATCVKIIDQAWQSVTQRTLNAAWRKLWPEAVTEGDFACEQPLGEIAWLGRCIGLEVDEEDINELIEEHREVLTTEELQHLQTLQHSEVDREFNTEDEIQEDEITTTAEIKEMLGYYHTITDFIEKNHPEKVQTGRAAAQFNEVCLSHFRNMLKNRQRHMTLDRYFGKRHDRSDVTQHKVKRRKKSD